MKARVLGQSALIVSIATALPAQNLSPSLSTFGTTGVIDTPTAESFDDAQLSTTLSLMKDNTRGSFSFQFLPRLSGTFRYAKFDNWYNTDQVLYDRSFDLQYRFLDEGRLRPSMAIGLRDFMGTGVYSSQYLVATKNFGPKVKVSTGLGWGRLNDTDIRTSIDVGEGGVPNFGEWFEGDPGVFGGLEWQTPVKGLRFKAEYSSDRYVPENQIRGTRTEPTFNRRSPYNFGLEYHPRGGRYQLGLYSLYGDTIGFSVGTILNPKEGVGLRDNAPLPVFHRPPTAPRVADWANAETVDENIKSSLVTLMNRDGLSVEHFWTDGKTAELRFRNEKYQAVTQAIGRAARSLSRTLPASVEEFVLIPVDKGLASAQVTIMRSDLEDLENNPRAAQLLSKKVGIEDPALLDKDRAGTSFVQDDLYPKLSWGIDPYLTISLFDPANSFATTVGVRAHADYDVRPGLTFSGAVIKKFVQPTLGPNLSPSALPPVRTNISYYANQGDPALEYLTANYMTKLAPSTYGRVTVGYLEEMFGGVSAEVLWKPTNQKWGIGGEINAVRQRDFDQRFGFQEYSTVTGHVSGYFDLPRGYQMRVDVGQYLAGDKGATLSIERTFGNGWRLGAYATVTDVPFEDFGEGSFDKGIQLDMPIGWLTGTTSKKVMRSNLASLSRDGGAKLNVQNRLHDVVSDSHLYNLSRSWGRVWR